MFEKITEAILKNVRHNPAEWIAGLVLAIMLILLFGCEPTTESIRNPEIKVTRSQLKNEIDFYLASAEAAFEDLNKKQQLRNLVFNQAFIIAEGGIINPVGILSMLGNLFGISVFVDNRKKDSVIKKLKNSTK